VGPKKTCCERKNVKRKNGREEKKCKMRKKTKRKKRSKRKKYNDVDQVGDNFIPSMKSHNMIF
jgi:hypothetical protein